MKQRGKKCPRARKRKEKERERGGERERGRKKERLSSKILVVGPQIFSASILFFSFLALYRSKGALFTFPFTTLLLILYNQYFETLRMSYVPTIFWREEIYRELKKQKETKYVPFRFFLNIFTFHVNLCMVLIYRTK